MLQRFARDTVGASAIEYTLFIGLVATLIMSAVGMLGADIAVGLSNLAEVAADTATEAEVAATIPERPMGRGAVRFEPDEPEAELVELCTKGPRLHRIEGVAETSDQRCILVHKPTPIPH